MFSWFYFYFGIFLMCFSRIFLKYFFFFYFQLFVYLFLFLPFFSICFEQKVPSIRLTAVFVEILLRTVWGTNCWNSQKKKIFQKRKNKFKHSICYKYIIDLKIIIIIIIINIIYLHLKSKKICLYFLFEEFQKFCHKKNFQNENKIKCCTQ